MATPKVKTAPTTSATNAPQPAPASDNFFKLQELTPLETVLKAENSTTSTVIENPQSIKFIELRGDGAIISVPLRTCAEGHFLLVKIAVKNMTSFEFTAKITETERHGDRLHVAFEFSQIEKQKWDALIEAYSKRQSDISSIVEKIRS